jgi:hypothetical protein
LEIEFICSILSMMITTSGPLPVICWIQAHRDILSARYMLVVHYRELVVRLRLVGQLVTPSYGFIARNGGE